MIAFNADRSWILQRYQSFQNVNHASIIRLPTRMLRSYLLGSGTRSTEMSHGKSQSALHPARNLCTIRGKKSNL